MKHILAILLTLLVTPTAVAQTQTPDNLSPEAIALGRELAGQGMLSKLLPMVAQKETEEMVASLPELSDPEKEALRTIARENYELGLAKVIDTQGKIYALSLSIDDLKALTEFNRGPAAQHFGAIQPKVIEATISGLDGVDFKGATMKAFCAKTGKGCRAEKAR